MLDDSAQEEKEEELCSKLQLFSTSPGSRSPGVCWESFQATVALQHHRRFLIFCTTFWTIHVLLSCVFQSCHFCILFFALVTIWFISGRGVRTKKIVRVDEVMRRSFNCSHSSSTRLRTALDESKLASLKIPHEVVKAGLSKVLSCYHYELISFLHLLHSYGVSSYCHQRCPLSLWAMRISSAWLAVESTSDKLFGYCRPYFRFHGRVMLLNVESQTNVDPTLGPVMYVVTFEFSYGGRVNGRGKNYKLGCDVLFKCTCECYKHHTNSANISKRSVLSTFPRSSKIFKLWLFSFAISIRWWIIFVSNTRTMK